MRLSVDLALALILAVLGGSAENPPQRNMVAPVACEPCPDLEFPRETVIRCECVDLTGDGILDFIILAAADSGLRGDSYMGRETWITSAGKTVLTRDRWHSDYAYRWFVNLDDDPESEVVAAYGFSDGIDYTIEDLQLSDGQLLTLLHFEPVLVGRDQLPYHGYPWDLQDLRLRQNGERTEILAGIKERMPTESEDGADNTGIDDSQRRIPRILFVGESTQPQLARLKEFAAEWYTIARLMELSFK